MYYQQLKDFLKQSEQKVFWIFSYANLAGLVLGFFAARYIAEQITWAPAPLLYVLGIVGGLLATWPREARPLYKLLLLRLFYETRRQLLPKTLLFTGAVYYRVPVTGVRPLTIAGVLTYRGDRGSAYS
jgi:hypothetical protein